MSSEKVLQFSKEHERLSSENVHLMMKFLDAWEKKGTDKEQYRRFAQSEKRRMDEFSLKTDGEIIAIVNRGTPETWAEDTWRYSAALMELRRRGHLVDATT